MFSSLKSGGKIAVQYLDRPLRFLFSAFKELNPETADRLCAMFQFDERANIERYCSSVGFHIVKSYETLGTQPVFESIESLLKFLWSTTHGVFDPSLVTEERLQRYYPYSSRNGKAPFDFRGIKEESSMCRLVAIK